MKITTLLIEPLIPALRRYAHGLMRDRATADDLVPMAQHSRGSVSGFAWADKGIGYSLVGHISSQLLHSLADEARRQLGDDV